MAGVFRMDDRNPYAPSQASLQVTQPVARTDGSSVVEVWRDDGVLVMLPGAALPQRCIKCNEPSHEPTKARKVYWHHPALYLLVLVNLIIYAIVAAVIRRKAFVNAGLCSEHKKRRRTALILAWTGALTGIVLMFFGADSSLGIGGVFLGALLILGSIIAGMIFARVIYARRIDKSYVRLKGCGGAFLDSLPPFSGLPG
jgi:hypothetical protein